MKHIYTINRNISNKVIPSEIGDKVTTMTNSIL